MKKRALIPIVLTILGVACAGLSFVPWTGIVKGSSSSWMKDLDDNLLLSEISLPGSHDSGAMYSLGDLTGKCQDASIIGQLTFGTRFLDIRLEIKKGKLQVCHGIVDERLPFDQVVANVNSFLEDNPKETVVMSIKQENNDDDPETFNRLLAEKIGDDKHYFTENRIPTLGEVRGKIVVLSRYANPTLGIPLHDGWLNPHDDRNTFDISTPMTAFHIQDNYELDSIDVKWSEFEECLSYASLTGGNIFVLNFASGYLKNYFPMSYSVPVAKEMNPKVLASVKDYPFVGTIILDFVSEELCKAIYGRNFA